MMRRRRPLMRAAMVGGTAYAVGKHAQRGQQAEADQEARLEQLEAQQAYQAAPAPAPVPAGGPTDLASKLTQLKALLDQGALTPDEYATAKAQLLAGG
jgi:hypothetical protein